MRILDLFAGIGGFSFAGHRLGWETAAFVERDKFCQAVLKSRFGAALAISNDELRITNEEEQLIPIYDDITTFDGRAFRGRCDVVTAGFPCQPFSAAGKRQGDSDDRFLWPETVRVVDEARPEWCVFENVAGLLSMVESDTLSDVEVKEIQLFHADEDYAVNAVVEQVHRRIVGRILADLEAIGYSPLRMPDGTPVILCLPACAVGAWHRRDRLWIVCYDERSATDTVRERCDGWGEQGKDYERTVRAGRGNDKPFGESAIGDREPIADSHDAGIGASRGGTDAFRPPEGVERDIALGQSVGQDLDAPHAEQSGTRSESGSSADERRRTREGGRKGLRSGNGAIGSGGIEPTGSNAADSGDTRLQRSEQADESRLSGFGDRERGNEAQRLAYDHWLEAAGELCRVVYALPAELDAADIDALSQAVKHYGREEVERKTGLDLREVESRVWRTERLKALGNSIVPDVFLQIAEVIERLRK